MKNSAVLSAICCAAVAVGHGIVSEMKIGGASVSGYNPFRDQYQNPAPERIVWAFPSAGNGPVEDVSSADIVCNKGATPGKISQKVAAGSDVTFMWTVWPRSHKGPAMTYMAACPGADCSNADATTLDFFKIHQAGLNADGSWASDDLIANNNSITARIPSDLKPGAYLMRHELLALHSAGNNNGAQFYPMCANLIVEGSGSAKPDGVKFPGAYKADDAGILINIYYPKPTSYAIPGPKVYGSGANGSTPPAPPETSPYPYPPSRPAPPATTNMEFNTVSSAPARQPTTLVTRTRPCPSPVPTQSTGSNNNNGSGKSSVDINKCLDKVNQCIARSQRSGGTNFDDCESRRVVCY